MLLVWEGEREGGRERKMGAKEREKGEGKREIKGRRESERVDRE